MAVCMDHRGLPRTTPILLIMARYKQEKNRKKYDDIFFQRFFKFGKSMINTTDTV